MTIGVDIDDTLINTRSVQKLLWREYVQNNHNSKYSEKLPSNINQFGDEYINIFWDTYRHILATKPRFKMNASRVIATLRLLGHKVVIVTSRPKEKYNSLDDWLKQHQIIVDAIYMDIRNKAEFMVEENIDLLIDDDVNHCMAAIKLNKKAILFNKNKNYTGLQVTSWNSVLKVISKRDYFG